MAVPLTSTSNSSVFVWMGILIFIIVAVGVTSGKSNFLSFGNQSKVFKQTGQMTAGLNESWILTYKDSKEVDTKIVLNFDEKSLCNSEAEYKPCVIKNLKANKKVLIEGNQVENKLTVTKLTSL